MAFGSTVRNKTRFQRSSVPGGGQWQGNCVIFYK